jgi:hypothetical protein
VELELEAAYCEKMRVILVATARDISNTSKVLVPTNAHVIYYYIKYIIYKPTRCNFGSIVY